MLLRCVRISSSVLFPTFHPSPIEPDIMSLAEIFHIFLSIDAVRISKNSQRAKPLKLIISLFSGMQLRLRNIIQIVGLLIFQAGLIIYGAIQVEEVRSH